MAEQTEAIQPETIEIPTLEIPDQEQTALAPATEYDAVIQQLTAHVGNLSGFQTQVLGKLCLNILSGNIQTDVDIAADLGIHRDTVGNYRRNPVFATALSLLMRSLAQGTADKALGNLMKLSEKDTKATEIWLRIAKVFDPVQKTFNVNAQLPMQDQAKTLEAVIDEFLMNLGASGYPIEKIVQRFHELRSEGAF